MSHVPTYINQFASWYAEPPYPSLANISSLILDQCGQLALSTERVSKGNVDPYSSNTQKNDMFSSGYVIFYAFVCAWAGVSAFWQAWMVWKMSTVVNSKTKVLAKELGKLKPEESDDKTVTEARNAVEMAMHKIHTNSKKWVHISSNLMFWMGLTSLILLFVFGNGTFYLVFTAVNRMMIGFLDQILLFLATGILQAYGAWSMTYTKKREWNVFLQVAVFSLVNFFLFGYLLTIQAEACTGQARSFAFSAGMLIMLGWAFFFLMLLLWRMIGHLWMKAKEDPDFIDESDEESAKMLAAGGMSPIHARNKAIGVLRHAHLERDMHIIQIFTYMGYAIATGFVAGKSSDTPMYQFWNVGDFRDAIVVPSTTIAFFVAVQIVAFSMQLAICWHSAAMNHAHEKKNMLNKVMPVASSSDDMSDKAKEEEEKSEDKKKKMKKMMKKPSCCSKEKWCSWCKSEDEEEEEAAAKAKAGVMPIANASTGASLYW